LINAYLLDQNLSTTADGDTFVGEESLTVNRYKIHRNVRCFGRNVIHFT